MSLFSFLFITQSFLLVLECDQTLSTNNNHQANAVREQRYVEQERPIHSHFGLALFALLIFPPIGKPIDVNEKTIHC